MDQTERCESDDAESREETLRMELQDSKSQIQKLSEMMKEMTEKLEKMQGGTSDKKRTEEGVEDEDEEPQESGRMETLKGFNPKDMPKPIPSDMEPGHFHNWNGLFQANMMSIDFAWGKILKTLHEIKTPLSKDKVGKLQNDMVMKDKVKETAKAKWFKLD